MGDISYNPLSGTLPTYRPPGTPVDPAADWEDTVRGLPSKNAADAANSAEVTSAPPVNSTGPTLTASGEEAESLIPAPSSAEDPLLTSRTWKDFLYQQATSFGNGSGTFADHIAQIRDFLIVHDPKQPNPGALNDPAQSLSYLTDKVGAHTEEVADNISSGFLKSVQRAGVSMGQGYDGVLDKLQFLQNPGSDPNNPAGRTLSALGQLTANNSQVLRYTVADIAVPSTVPGLKFTGNLRVTMPINSNSPSAHTSVAGDDLILNATLEVGGGTAASAVGALSGGLEATAQLAFHKDADGHWGIPKVKSVTAQANADANISNTVKNGLFAGARWLNSAFNRATNNGAPQEVALQTFNTNQNPLFEVGSGGMATGPGPNRNNPLFQIQSAQDLDNWYSAFGASAPGPRGGFKVEPWNLGEMSLGVSWVRNPITDKLEAAPGIANLSFKHFDGVKAAAGVTTPRGFGLGTDVRAYNAASTGFGFAWTPGGVSSLRSNSYWTLTNSHAG